MATQGRRRRRGFNTTYDYLDNRTAEADGPTVEQIEAMSDKQLVVAAEKQVAFVDEWYVTLWPPFFFYATGALGGLGKLLEHWYDGDTATTFQDLICGIPGNKAALEGEALFGLADQIRGSAELRSLFDVHQGDAFFAAARASQNEQVGSSMPKLQIQQGQRKQQHDQTDPCSGGSIIEVDNNHEAWNDERSQRRRHEHPSQPDGQPGASVVRQDFTYHRR